MKVSAIQIVRFGFPLLSSLNVDGQALRILEIYVNDKITTVEIDISKIPDVVKKILEIPYWLQSCWNRFKEFFALESGDDIIIGNSKAIVEINNLMDGCIEF
jgi:hypothetical protein